MSFQVSDTLLDQINEAIARLEDSTVFLGTAPDDVLDNIEWQFENNTNVLVFKPIQPAASATTPAASTTTQPAATNNSTTNADDSINNPVANNSSPPPNTDDDSESSNEQPPISPATNLQADHDTIAEGVEEDDDNAQLTQVVFSGIFVCLNENFFCTSDGRYKRDGRYSGSLKDVKPSFLVQGMSIQPYKQQYLNVLDKLMRLRDLVPAQTQGILKRGPIVHLVGNSSMAIKLRHCLFYVSVFCTSITPPSLHCPTTSRTDHFEGKTGRHFCP